MQEEIKALREEISKLRERVAVLEAAKPAMTLDWAKQALPHVGTPMPYYSHSNFPPAVCPDGSKFSIMG